jgi:type II secretory pathway pseudopilin PulG
MNKVDWTKWSAIAEILSAIAIVVTLAYLAVQTQYLAMQTEQNREMLAQNNDLFRAQIHQARSDNYEWFMAANADSEFFLPVWKKFADARGEIGDIAALDTLNDEEQARLRRYFQGRISGADNLFYQYRKGFLDEEFYEQRVVVTVRRILPVWEKLGLLRPDYMTPSFMAEIERIRSID